MPWEDNIELKSDLTHKLRLIKCFHNSGNRQKSQRDNT